MKVCLLATRNLYISFLLFLTVDSIKITECQLVFKQTNEKNLIKAARLLTIAVELANSTKLPKCVVKNSDLIKPLRWKRISGTKGKGLLQLQPFYEMLSLSLLRYKTEETSITLQSKPSGCLENLNGLEYELVFRHFLLNFTRENEEICNEHIGNRSQYAIFYHECCHYDKNGNMQCNPVLMNKWMQAIEYCTYIVIIIVVLYCPLFVPSSLYDPKYGPKVFVHSLEEPYSFTLKKKTSQTTRWQYLRERLFKQTGVPYAKFKDMTKFKKELRKMKEDQIYRVKVSKLYFRVHADEILDANESPIGLFEWLYYLFVKCGIRKKKSISLCCNANMFGNCLQSQVHYEWYKLLRLLVRIIVLVVFCLPWIIRIFIFYRYENEIREERHKAAGNQNLLVHIENNLAYYGTPVHILFLLSYGCMCFGYLFLELTSVFLLKNVRGLVFEILSKCFQGICSRLVIEILLNPFSESGIFGVFYLVPYWICAVPFSIVVFAYYFFPVIFIGVNFLCLLLNIFRGCTCNIDPSVKERLNKKSNKRFHVLDIGSDEKQENLTSHSKAISSIEFEIGLMFVLLLLMLSSLLLTVDLVIFLIRVVIYTMVGLILNSSHAMQYISIISLVWLYYRKCFSGISKIYTDYKKAVHKIMYRVNKRQLDKIAHKETKNQENTAFKVIIEGGKGGYQVNKQAKRKKIEIFNGAPTFMTNSVILLLDRFDKQYITKNFFFKVCKIESDGPGPVSKYFIIAVRQFGMILIFLIFVTLVVLGFGDSYSLTLSNQLLATLAGGVVPFILLKSNILFARADKIDANELVERYFSDKDITNELIITKIEELKILLSKLEEGEGNEKNIKIADKTKNTNSPEAETPHQLKNGEIIVKGVFKKKFNDKIGKDEKWWNIADIDVTYEETKQTSDDIDLRVSMCKYSSKKHPKPMGKQQSSNDEYHYNDKNTKDSETFIV